MIELTVAAEICLPQVLAIEHACIAPPWTEGTLLGELGREDGRFALACDGETVLGFAIARQLCDEAELYQIAVDPNSRRLGVASLLLQDVLRWCRDQCVVSLFLEVRRSNESAIGLYKKHGFKAAGRRKNYYSDPVEDAVIMTRDITANL